MKRRKVGPGPDGGFVFGNRYVRNLDHWRQLAAIPLPSWEVASEIEDSTGEMRWTVTANGATVSTWYERDAPGLGAWIADVMKAYSGAWHEARRASKLTRTQQNGGQATAETRRQAALERDEEIEAAARNVIKANGQMTKTELADVLATRGLGGAAALEKRLRKLRKKSSEGHSASLRFPEEDGPVK